jgi:hypothetical protein
MVLQQPALALTLATLARIASIAGTVQKKVESAAFVSEQLGHAQVMEDSTYEREILASCAALLVGSVWRSRIGHHSLSLGSCVL